MYDLVEEVIIFDTSTNKNIKLQGTDVSRSFKKFITNMLNDISDDTFTHEKLMESSWMKR